MASIEVRSPLLPGFSTILSPDALAFLADLQRYFGHPREKLLARRQEVQKSLDKGVLPDFLSDTREVREDDWKIAPEPEALQDRRVEITGPVDRKMVINALNSGARVYMADFEDSHAPTWAATIQGQINLRDAVRKEISFESPEGKSYRLNETVATLMVRPRGWHLYENHVFVEGKAMSASLFDFGLFFFHNAKEQIARGAGPYFYLPKLESHLEARLWNDVFVYSQKRLGIPNGTIKATVLIETILAAFEMDEILFELKDHSAGLNCGRWDYIFSFIKKFRNRKDFVLPDRAAVTMTTPFLKAYSELLIKTCHRRGAHAMGGMAAQIPIKEDAAANAAAISKVVADKEREVNAGHDGTWVAHPGLVAVAKKVFDDKMPGPHQLGNLREDVDVTASDLLQIPPGEITEQGLRTNIRVGVQYLEAWLRGSGCVPLYHLMEDAATAEISRAQIWQWIHHGRISAEHFKTVLKEELAALKLPKIELAGRLFQEISLSNQFPDFITLVAYDYIVERTAK